MATELNNMGRNTKAEGAFHANNSTGMLPVPGISWNETPAASHFVQFYEADDFLLKAVSGFIGAGLGAGEVCIVLVTKAHRTGLEALLRENGLDLTRAHARGKYIVQDAAETLAQFMEDGRLKPERFMQIIGSLLEQAAQNGHHIRIFGEMVALLWKDGKQEAAIHLEALWNELHQKNNPAFSLFCAYPLHSFSRIGDTKPFIEMCQQHAYVIPAESYTRLASSPEHLSMISVLQQKAVSLEAEIAERKKAEAQLQESAERLRFMAESMPQKIFTARPDGAVDYFNPQWTEFTGLAFEEIKDWGWKQFIHPEDLEENVRQWQHSIETEEPFYFEHRFLRADGVYCWHISRAIPMRDAQGHIKMWIGSNTDITEQKELERQKEILMSMATHELKTPLTSLQGYIQLAERQLRRLQKALPDQQELLDQILSMLSRGQQQLSVQKRLIADLLDVSRMQESALELRLAPCDLVHLVRETIQDCQATHQGRLITLDLPEQEVILVQADRDRIVQVLNNYLTNALKYSAADKAIQVGISACSPSQVHVWVADQGPGLAREAQEHIWEPFYRAPDIEVKNRTGVSLGLGLSICQGIISNHQGQVGVESTPGQGSRFWFTLPLYPEEN